MNDERLNQIKEKREKKQMLSQQEDKFFEEWNRQLEELAKRDAQKNEYRRRIDRETSDGLRRQVTTYSNFSCLFLIHFYFQLD
jgi:biopolymer transport protein ExbB/TolQ